MSIREVFIRRTIIFCITSKLTKGSHDKDKMWNEGGKAPTSPQLLGAGEKGCKMCMRYEWLHSFQFGQYTLQNHFLKSIRLHMFFIMLSKSLKTCVVKFCYPFRQLPIAVDIIETHRVRPYLLLSDQIKNALFPLHCSMFIYCMFFFRLIATLQDILIRD